MDKGREIGFWVPHVTKKGFSCCSVFAISLEAIFERISPHAERRNVLLGTLEGLSSTKYFSNGKGRGCSYHSYKKFHVLLFLLWRLLYCLNALSNQIIAWVFFSSACPMPGIQVEQSGVFGKGVLHTLPPPPHLASPPHLRKIKDNMVSTAHQKCICPAPVNEGWWSMLPRQINYCPFALDNLFVRVVAHIFSLWSISPAVGMFGRRLWNLCDQIVYRDWVLGRVSIPQFWI